MSIHLTNTGTTITTINNKKMNEISWNANYDGKEADIHLQYNFDGKQEKIDLKLSNEELKNLLNVPIVDRPIDQRLSEDFLMNMPRRIQLNKHTKTKTKKQKKSKQKTKKSKQTQNKKQKQ